VAVQRSHTRARSGSAPQFDAYAAHYDDALRSGLRYSGEDSTYFVRGRLAALGGRLGELGERPRIVLDFGCGTGLATALLSDLLAAERVIGVDVSPASLAVATSRHARAGVEFQASVPPLDCGFDCAYCNGVFHHIAPSERGDAIASVSSALRPNGVFALCENNPWNPGTRLVMKAIPFDREAAPLAAPEARRLLRAGGFEVLSTDFLFVFPRATRWCRRFEKRLKRLPLGAQYMVLARKPATRGTAP
jgi:SAM-dependent methyltransferase